VLPARLIAARTQKHENHWMVVRRLSNGVTIVYAVQALLFSNPTVAQAGFTIMYMTLCLGALGE
jgi:hypothetical protein